MSKQYEMGIFVMNFLKNLGLNVPTIGHAIEDKNLLKSYQTIKNNPQISKEQFLKFMKIEEFFR